MADKPTLNTFVSNSRLSVTELNENFDTLASALESALGRGGVSESPNSMSGTLDMDLNPIQNVGPGSADNDAARLVDILDSDTTGAASAQLRIDLGNNADNFGVDLVANATRRVDTYTELKAITSQSDNDIVIVAGRSSVGDGGWGVFQWDSSDLSTEVASDTQSGVYVAPDSDPTGASGVWVRVYGGELLATWFGLSSSGTGADNAAALEAALSFAAADGGRVRIPQGAYTVDATTGILVDGAGVYLQGDGRENTILNLAGNGDVLTFQNTGRGWGVSGMSFKYGTPATSGSVIKAETAATSGKLSDIYIESCDVGITLGNAQATEVSHIEIWDFQTTAVSFSGNLNDVYCHNWFLNGNNNPSAVGWASTGKAHAVMGSNIEIIQCNQTTQWIGAASSTNTFAFSRFFNCFFDSSTSPAYHQYLYDVEFHGCWWSQRETGATFLNSTGVKFFGGGAVNCDNHGMIWDTGCDDFEAHGLTFDSNSQSVSGSFDGLVVTSGVSNFRIFGGYSGNHGVTFPATQGRGIALLGSNTNYIISGIKFESNINTPIAGHTASVSERVVDSFGYVTKNGGTTTINTDANGEDTIAHGLSVEPTHASVHVVGDTPQEATIVSVDATNITIRIRDTTSDADLGTGSVSVMWSASAET